MAVLQWSCISKYMGRQKCTNWLLVLQRGSAGGIVVTISHWWINKAVKDHWRVSLVLSIIHHNSSSLLSIRCSVGYTVLLVNSSLYQPVYTSSNCIHLIILLHCSVGRPDHISITCTILIACVVEYVGILLSPQLLFGYTRPPASILV